MKRIETVTTFSALQKVLSRLGSRTPAYAVVGSPLSHQYTADFIRLGLEEFGSEALIVKMDILPEKFDVLMHDYLLPKTRTHKWNLKGVALCSPFKSRGMRYVRQNIDHAHDATFIGSVNTLVCQADEVVGYNTESEAFLTTLTKSTLALDQATFAVLGHGATARSVVWALINADSIAAKVKVLSKDRRQAKHFAEKHHADSYGAISSFRGGAEVLVNATPYGREGTEFQAESILQRPDAFTAVQIAYDTNLGPTRFLQEAKKKGCITIDGGEMFLIQAELQFHHLTGKALVRTKMREEMQPFLH